MKFSVGGKTTVREADKSIKPGVKRSGTPGTRIVKNDEPAERATEIAFAKNTFPIRCRPLRGLRFFCGLDPGVPLRFTQGFTLTCAARTLRKFQCQLSHLRPNI